MEANNIGTEQFVRDIDIIKSCQAQGGTWEQAQLRGADLSDALSPYPVDYFLADCLGQE